MNTALTPATSELSGKLSGKVALVTGGTSGIGLATARRFVAEGAHVFITGRRQSALDAAVQAIGPQATGIRADASSLVDLDQLFAQIQKDKGHLDVLFANAGIAKTLRPASRPSPERVRN